MPVFCKIWPRAKWPPEVGAKVVHYVGVPLVGTRFLCFVPTKKGKITMKTKEFLPGWVILANTIDAIITILKWVGNTAALLKREA